VVIDSLKRFRADERRTQLLELGRELLNTRHYDEISIDDIAQAAGISKGLLYHYFSSKEDFFVAGVERGSAQLLAACDPDPALSHAQQLMLGIRGYLDYVERNAFSYLNLFRGETATLPGIQRVCEHTREALAERFLGGLGAGALALHATRCAVRAAEGFIEALVLDWIERGVPSRTEVEKLSLSSTLTAIYVGVQSDVHGEPAALALLSAAVCQTAAEIEREYAFKIWPRTTDGFPLLAAAGTQPL
jgi:AcrR family transcriptional regulator